MPSIYEEAESIKKGVRRRKAYRIHVGDRESLRKLARMLAVPLEFVDKEQHKSWFDEDFLYTPITRTTKEGYSGKVYNLEVEGAHSFVTGPAALHNCGDVMYLYIKVKDGRIKDVKFETYGCAAAIATSSMITDLAKGKTLKEALEISRGNVSSELGGLPPIKEHCSNLAADALHAAIKDYLSRHPEVKI
jgi:nitrogen fixation NifU-like protein